MSFSPTLQYTVQVIGDSALNRVAGGDDRTIRDHDNSSLLGEPEPPSYDTTYFSAFPEREEIKLVEQEGLEPSASTMPSSRSVQLSYCPTYVAL